MKMRGQTLFLTFISILVQHVLGTYHIYGPKTRFMKRSPMDDFYLVAERLDTPEDTRKWSIILAYFENKTRISYYKGGIENISPLPVPEGEELREGSDRPDPAFFGGSYNAGLSTIQYVDYSLGTGKEPELWIAYIWCKGGELPPREARIEDLWWMEMAVTVTWRDPPGLYSWHMGITRNYFYALRKGGLKHGHISGYLHGIGAFLVKQEHPGALYMATRPVPAMLRLLRTSFKDELGRSAFDADEMEQWGLPMPIRRAKDDSWTIHSLDGDLLWEGQDGSFSWPRNGGGVNPLFVVLLDAVIEKLDVPSIEIIQDD